MTQDFYLDVALDICRYNSTILKENLLTYLSNVHFCDSYSFHDTDIVKRRAVNKEIICIHFVDINSVIKVIQYIKRMKGMYVDCVYDEYKIIFASHTYSKKMNKDKVREWKERPKTEQETRIIDALRFSA